MRMICLLLLPYLFLLGTAGHRIPTHMSDMCTPKISKQELYDLALKGAINAMIRQVELHNNQKPVSLDKMVEISSMISKYIMAGQSISFIIRILHIQCHLNKPVESPKEDAASEVGHLCVWEHGAEKCYDYKDKKEGEVVLVKSPTPNKKEGESAPTPGKKEGESAPTPDKKEGEPAAGISTTTTPTTPTPKE